MYKVSNGEIKEIIRKEETVLTYIKYYDDTWTAYIMSVSGIRFEHYCPVHT